MTEEMFSGDSADVTAQIDTLARKLALDMDAYTKMDRELKDRKDQIDRAKETLCCILEEAGMESCKLACGLNPKATNKKKFGKAEGIGDEQMHEWLRKVNMGDIIVPYVHYGTLQSALQAREAGGNEVSEDVFKTWIVKGVTLYGKSKFLAEVKR